MAKVKKKFINNNAWKAPAGVRSVTVIARRKTRAVPTYSGGNDQSFGISDAAGPHFIDAMGNLFGWGANNQGIIGDGTSVPKSSPVAVAGGRTWEYVTSHWNSSIRQVLALTNTRDAYVWGTRAANFPLGGGETANVSSPILVLGGIKWKKVMTYAGPFFGIDMNDVPYACGIQASNAAILGVNTITATSSPVAVVGGLRVHNIAASPVVSLFLTKDDDLYACGQGTAGSLGQVGSIINRSSPVMVSGGFKWADAIVNFGACLGIRKDNGNLYVWGDNSFGQVADPSVTFLSTPTLMAPGRWLRIKIAGTKFLAQNENGLWYGWGPGPQYGYPSVPADPDLVDFSNPSFTSPVILAGQQTRKWRNIFTVSENYFFQDEQGYIYAMGSNGEGQLGIGNTDSPSSPTILAGSPKFVKVFGYTPNLEFAQTVHGLDPQGRLWSWGLGSVFGAGGGQLGDGTIVSKSSPVLVAGQRVGKANDVIFNQELDVVPGTTYGITVGGYIATFGQYAVGEDIDEIELIYDK